MKGKTKTSIAVIGCGEQAIENLLPSLLQIEDSAVIGLCDIDESKTIRASRIFPEARVYTDYSDLLSQRDLEAVVLAGPPQMHFDAAQLALQNGKHVFVEKPPTVTTAELQQLVQLAGTNDLVTAVGHNMRYARAVVETERILSKDWFGKLLSMDIRYLAAQPLGTRWGLESVLRSFLLSHAIHAIDLMIALMGKVEDLTVTALELPTGATLVSILFRFQYGRVGTLLAGTCGTHFQIDVHLIGASTSTIHVKNLREVTVYRLEKNSKRWGRVWNPRPLEGGYAHSGYLGELVEFIKAIRKRRKASPSFKDEIEVYAVIDEIESQARGLVTSTES